MPGITRKSRPKPPAVLLFFSFTLFLSLPPLFSLGKAEGPQKIEVIEKSETVVYICDVDVSRLPAEQRIAGLQIRTALVNFLAQIHERKRSHEEITQYQNRLWQQRQDAAAKALADARNTRDMLLFKGYSKQKYESELEKITASIRDLEKKQTQVRENPPLIAETAQLVLHRDMANGVFSGAPKDVERKNFCQTRSIDLLLSSSLRELYGRWILSYSMYRAIDDRELYSDIVAFAPEELESILPQIGSVLYQVCSGLPTGAVQISAQPDSAGIIVNEEIKGRGTTPVLEGPPEDLRVTITNPGYFPNTFILERKPDYLSRARLSLSPMARNVFQISSSDFSELKLYIDGFYRGQSPLSVELPKGLYSLQVIKGSGDSEVQSVPFILRTEDGTLSIQDSYLQKGPEKPVERARKQFYNAFGRFWIALPVAFIINGVADTYINAINYGGNENLLDPATTWYYSAQGAWVLTGVFLVETLYRLGSYVYSANRETSPVIEPHKE